MDQSLPPFTNKNQAACAGDASVLTEQGTINLGSSWRIEALLPSELLITYSVCTAVLKGTRHCFPTTNGFCHFGLHSLTSVGLDLLCLN